MTSIAERPGVIPARPAASSAPPSRLAVRAAAIGVVAILVSATGSWIPSLWGDEATSVMSASRPLTSLVDMLMHVDAVHGLYYAVLHGWIEVFGSTPFAVRFPSAIGAGVSAAAVVWLVGRLIGPRWGLLAGVFAAILPRLTYAGEEARSYAFDAAIATVLCVIAVEIMLRHPARRRWWVAYAGVLALGTWSFLYLSLMSVPVLVALLAYRPTRHLWRRWLAWSAIGAAGASPVLVLALLQHNQIAYLSHRAAVTVSTVFVQMWFQTPAYAVLGWALIVVAAAGFAVESVRARRHAAHTVGLEPIVFAWLIVPMGVLVAVSPLIADFTSRYGTLAAPAAAIAMTLGVRRLAHVPVGRPVARAVAAALALAVVVGAVPLWAVQRTPYAKNGSDWNEIAQVIRTQDRPGDAIVFDGSARPSRRPRLAMDTDPSAFRAVRDVLLKTPYGRSVWWWDDTYTIAQAATRGRFIGVDRVWLVEYAPGGAADTWGMRALERLGYRPAAGIHEHSSVITLLTRRAVPPRSRPATSATGPRG